MPVGPEPRHRAEQRVGRGVDDRERGTRAVPPHQRGRLDERVSRRAPRTAVGCAPSGRSPGPGTRPGPRAHRPRATAEAAAHRPSRMVPGSDSPRSVSPSRSAHGPSPHASDTLIPQVRLIGERPAGDLRELRQRQPGGCAVLQRVWQRAAGGLPVVRSGQPRRCAVLQRVRAGPHARARASAPSAGTAARRPRRGRGGPGHGAPDRERHVRRPGGLHGARRRPGPGGGPGVPRSVTSHSPANASSGMAGPSRSSSVTRSWPSGARPWRTRMTRSGRSGRRSTCSTRSAVCARPMARRLRPVRRRHRRGGGDAQRRRPGHGRR